MSNPTGESPHQNGGNGAGEDAPYKVFQTKEEYGNVLNHRHQEAYNGGLSKAFKDASKLASSMGIDLSEDVKSVDGIFEAVSNYISEVKGTPNKEVEALQSQIQKANSERDLFKNKLQGLKDNTAKSILYDSAIQKMQKDGDLVIGGDQIKVLFEASENIVRDGDSFYVERSGIPIMDENGKKSTLDSVFMDFAIDKKLFTPSARGAGGGTGNASLPTSKPSYEEYKKAHSLNDREAKSRLLAQAQKAGSWKEIGAPKVY